MQLYNEQSKRTIRKFQQYKQILDDAMLVIDKLPAHTLSAYTFSGSGMLSVRWQLAVWSFAIALFGLLFVPTSTQAAPPVDPLTATCAEGDFLHIQSGACYPLHTSYGFDSFPEPAQVIQLTTCEASELRNAVSVGNRRILLRSGCTYALGSADLRIQSNTIIDGLSPAGTITGGATVSGSEVISATNTGDQATADIETADATAGETIITCTGTTAFRIHDVSNVIIRNLTIDGMNNQQSNRGCGTLVFIDRGADNVLVERLRLQNGLGKGVGFRTATRVTVRYSWVQDIWDDHGLNADKRFVDIAYYSNYITNVGISSSGIGYGINSHATKVEIAGNYIENTDSGIKLMGARYTLLHHNTIIGATAQNPLYRGVWTAIDDKDNVRPELLVYYDNVIDTGGERPFSILDGATDIYLAGNHYGNVSNFIPISDGSSVYRCSNSTDARLNGDIIDIESRLITFPDSGMGAFDPCTLQSAVGTSQAVAIAPQISQEPENRRVSEGQPAVLTVAAIGSGELTYQWQRRFSNGKWFAVHNGDGPSYTTRPLRLFNNGNQYRVKIRNEFGSALSRVLTLMIDPIDSCVDVSEEWQSRPILPQQGRFSATFLATAPAPETDGLIGLSLGAAKTFSDMAIIVRFAQSGQIDARDGLVYASDSAFEYKAGETLRIRIEADINRQIYSVYVAPYRNGELQGKEVEVADDFSFRSEQNGVKQLDTWSFWDGQAGLEVCDLHP